MKNASQKMLISPFSILDIYQFRKYLTYAVFMKEIACNVVLEATAL